jgi:3-oxoacid CoA-transferase B subunit
MAEPARRSRQEIAARVAEDIADGSYVNLGIGIPTLVADHLPSGQTPAGREVIFHSENGLLGLGPAPGPGEEDPEVINAGKQLVTILSGSCYMSHSDSFALIRGGHLDLAVLGAFQVSSRGDLANWATLGERAPAVGGAMDLAAGARAVWVTMSHTTSAGEPKLVEACTYPLTAAAVVSRVYTDLATLRVDRDQACFVVEELVDGISLDQLQKLTAASVV